MAKAKTKKEETMETSPTDEAPHDVKTPPKAGIATLDLDFGRTDLNALRDKLNEVISSLK